MLPDLMCRRIRHLNAASSGAYMAVDSRFVTGFADSDPLAPWTSRAPATMHAASVGASGNPLYQTAALNGQPGVLFDAGNDRLEAGTINDAEQTIMAVAVRSATATTNRCILGNRSSTEGVMWRTTTTALTPTQLGGTVLSVALDPTLPFVATLQTSAADNFFRCAANGGSFVSGANLYKTSAVNMRIGAAGGTLEYWGGHIFAVSIWPVVLTDALRRRFEQSLALSFRIPQS